MPTYPLRCPSCCRQVDRVCHSSHRDLPHRCVCGEQMVRLFNYRFGRSFFPEGFNPGVGTHVSSRHALDEALKVKEEAAWKSSGVDTTYTLVDDPAGFGLDRDRLWERRVADDRARLARLKAARSGSEVIDVSSPAGTGAGGSGGRRPPAGGTSGWQ